MNLHTFARLIFPRGSVRPVLRGMLKGTRFVVVPGMGMTYALGQDHWNFQFLRSRVKPGCTVYDVGANCGQMALFFSRLVGPAGRVVCFEPVPQNFSVLERNLRLNTLDNVTGHCLALAADDQGRKFTFDEDHHTMGTFVDRIAKVPRLQKTFDVKCDTLDQFIARGNRVPDVLKIDVEGAGADVLAGAEQLLRVRRPAIYFEIHASSASVSSEWDALRRLEKEFGYSIRDINQRFDQKRDESWDAAAWCEAAPDDARHDRVADG